MEIIDLEEKDAEYAKCRDAGKKLFEAEFGRWKAKIDAMEQGTWHLGIDQGTSNTCLASVVDHQWQEPVVLNVNGERQAPSVLHIDSDGSFSYGNNALMMSDPINTAKHIKRICGVPYVFLSIFIFYVFVEQLIIVIYLVIGLLSTTCLWDNIPFGFYRASLRIVCVSLNIEMLICLKSRSYWH